jgi:hypothetical protein
VQKEAALIDDVLTKDACALYELGVIPEEVDLSKEKPLIVGIDGGWVKGWKENPGFEIKCATVATGSGPGPGKKRHLKDRVGYACTGSLEEFRKRISVLAIKNGYRSASIRIFVSDGATWISKMINDWFPEALHVLDMFHLKQKVIALFGIRAEGAELLAKEQTLKACVSYNAERILGAIMSWIPPSPEKEERRNELVAYIEHNAQAINNHRHVSIHGSGWIEKGVDLMVSRRMKNRGMAWTERGSAHIVPLAVLRYNKQWDVYWNSRKGLLANRIA